MASVKRVPDLLRSRRSSSQALSIPTHIFDEFTVSRIEDHPGPPPHALVFPTRNILQPPGPPHSGAAMLERVCASFCK